MSRINTKKNDRHKNRTCKKYRRICISSIFDLILQQKQATLHFFIFLVWLTLVKTERDKLEWPSSASPWQNVRTPQENGAHWIHYMDVDFIEAFCHCSCWDTRTVWASKWQRNENYWWDRMEWWSEEGRETAGRQRKENILVCTTGKKDSKKLQRSHNSAPFIFEDEEHFQCIGCYFHI